MSVVAEPPAARSGDKQRLLQHEIEQLVVQAKRIGVELPEVFKAIEAHWSRLDKNTEVKRK